MQNIKRVRTIHCLLVPLLSVSTATAVSCSSPSTEQAAEIGVSPMPLVAYRDIVPGRYAYIITRYPGTYYLVFASKPCSWYRMPDRVFVLTLVQQSHGRHAQHTTEAASQQQQQRRVRTYYGTTLGRPGSLFIISYSSASNAIINTIYTRYIIVWYPSSNPSMVYIFSY